MFAFSRASTIEPGAGGPLLGAGVGGDAIACAAPLVRAGPRPGPAPPAPKLDDGAPLIVGARNGPVPSMAGGGAPPPPPIIGARPTGPGPPGAPGPGPIGALPPRFAAAPPIDDGPAAANGGPRPGGAAAKPDSFGFGYERIGDGPGGAPPPVPPCVWRENVVNANAHRNTETHL